MFLEDYDQESSNLNYDKTFLGYFTSKFSDLNLEFQGTKIEMIGSFNVRKSFNRAILMSFQIFSAWNIRKVRISARFAVTGLSFNLPNWVEKKSH